MDQLQHVAGRLAARRSAGTGRPLCDTWTSVCSSVTTSDGGAYSSSRRWCRSMGETRSEAAWPARSPSRRRARRRRAARRERQRQPARHRAALVDVRGPCPPSANRSLRAVRRLGRAEKQIPARPQREMERLDHAFLDRPIQVDEEVAAGEQIEVREWRVLDEIVEREQHQLAQLPANAIAARLADEEAPQAFGETSATSASV